MGIRSIFTSQERLFAEWMMSREFNKEIQAEFRFPEEKNQNMVMQSYYTIPEKSVSRLPTEKEQEAIRKVWLTRLNKPIEDEREARRKKQETSLGSDSVSNSEESISESDDVEIGAGRCNTPIPKQQPIYKIVHGPMVQKVEKKSAPEHVTYGNFWGETRFAFTEKQTGCFLVDGWLVVSIPEKKEDKPFEINDDIDITVAFKFDDGLDPIASKIAEYIKYWFELQSTKLLVVAKTSAAGATLFTVLVSALGKTDHLAGELFALALVIGCIAMYAMTFYSGVKLYNLYCFKDTMGSIQNLGDWVSQIRRSVINYPDLFNGAHSIQDFFTPLEQRAITAIDEYNRMGYIRRFFNTKPAVH